jgi:hypothetical protein
MFKRFAIAVLLLIAAFSARALEYTDVYYDHTSIAVNEDGWGVFLVQSEAFIFIAFYIYDLNNQPVWYTAQLTDDGTGKYTGPVYKTTGTYFGKPWNNADSTLPPPQVGTATFAPTDIYHATLTYTINGVGPIVKPLVRQTLLSYNMANPDYSGSMAGSIGGMTCDPAKAVPAFRATYNLAVTQTADAAETLVFTLVDAAHLGIVCTATGPLTHFGKLYQMGAGTTLTCAGPGQDGKARALTIDSLHPTGQGIEGKLSGDAGGGCTLVIHFSAVKNVNN